MESILFYCPADQVNYLPYLKPIISGRAALTVLSKPSLVSTFEIKAECDKKKINKVATCSEQLLNLLIGKKVSLNDYAGSIIEKHDIEFLILNPLEHLFKVPYGKFLYERYLSKFITPANWLELPEFQWEQFHPDNAEGIIDYLVTCSFMSIDIETFRNDPERAIDCVGFTGVRFIKGGYETRTIVVPMEDMFNVGFVRVVVGLPTPKVLQNGKYDSAYLMRYGAPIQNYAFDTKNLFHCWYSELPKRLDFITSFVLRKWTFWKDEGKSFDKQERYRYNAKDCFATACSLIAILRELPRYAIDNYSREFPLVFPCILAEMTGLKVNKELMDAERIRFEASLEVQLKKLRALTGSNNYNPSSSQQTLRLFEIIGCGDIKSTTPASRDKVAARHPLNKRLVKAVESYRKDRKLVSAYLRDEDPKTHDLKLWYGRNFFALNPDATDTARLASTESAYWCGMQIQNIPRDRKDIQVKRIFESDRGFLFGECDREQAEARDVAYLSGDTRLITAVDDITKDFHGTNASAFFGVPYADIVRSVCDPKTGEWKHETIDKELRDLSKRTNHGANYNMGPGVMLDTMGIEKVLHAKKMLKLPAHYSPLEVCKHLLDVYAKTYSVVKGAYYDKIKSDVRSTKMLVGPTGWTRYCFGNPDKNKQDLNAYVAHPSQSLNAMELNISYKKVFYEVWMPNQNDFKLGPQIHDSILFQYREGREDLAWKVKECMEIDTVVKDTFGIVRTMRIPAALKGNSRIWSDVETLKKKVLVSNG